MLTPDGPRVLEYNCRFGDPETQSVLPLVEGDFLAALDAAARGSVASAELGRSGEAAVTVVLAAGDYPAAGDRGTPIEGVEEAEHAGALVFHAGTALQRRTARHERRPPARRHGSRRDRSRTPGRRAYAAADLIRIDGARRRERHRARRRGEVA